VLIPRMIGHSNEVEKSFMPSNLSSVALASIEGIYNKLNKFYIYV